MAISTSNDLFTANPRRFLDATVIVLSMTVILSVHLFEAAVCALFELP
jgi:hypothetical protein